MRGFLARSLVGEARTPDEPAVDEDVVSACVWVSVWTGWLCAGLAAALVVVLSLLELPQPASSEGGEQRRESGGPGASARRLATTRRSRSRRGDSNP